MKKLRLLLELAGAVLLSLSAGAVGSLCSVQSGGGWYANLTKPFFNPPSWVFGPVWTVLYILMDISLFLVWQSEKGVRRTT